MDSRYLHASSPPRRYNSNRNSTGGAVDIHPTYDQYGNPRSNKDTISTSRPADRATHGPPAAPRIYRDHMPFRSRPDDYEVRRLDPIRRPVSVQPSAVTTYRPSLSSDKSPHQYSKPWPREDESYYIQPASSRRDLHTRNVSSDTGRKTDSYLIPSRSDRDRPERAGYRSSGIGGSRQVYHDVPQIRPPRDKDDKDFGYEYTDFKEQAYRDLAPSSRPRARRTSDLAGRERPHSITGVEDTYRSRPRDGYSRDHGPPVSTRGFSRIDQNGTIRHEYRYPREPDTVRSGDESDTPSRPRSHRPAVAVHQDRPDGYTSNTEERYRDHRHRLRSGSIDRSNRPRSESTDRPPRVRGDSIDRSLRRGGESFDRGNDERSRYTSESEDSRRIDHRERRYDSAQSESDDRRHRPNYQRRQHRDGSQDRYKQESSRRPDEAESESKERKHRGRGSEPEREHRHRERGEDYEKRHEDGKKDNHDSRYATSAAIGAAGTAVAGLLGAKHKDKETDKERERDKEKEKGKEKEKPGSDPGVDYNHRDAKSSAPTDHSVIESRREDNSEEERRERRRRRREEKEARARYDLNTTGVAEDKLAPTKDPRSLSHDRGGYSQEKAVSDDERSSRRHRRRRSERRHSSSASEIEEPERPRQVRVVSPAKQPEFKPKGILRPPRDKFPEDPAPVREGVAPLKDAGKKGIPPNARWTKIDRRLVNPEALELGNERFEERMDYVIVLRVLSKVEIEQYAQKTAEIREARHPPLIHEGDEEYDESGDDEPPTKAIEAQPYNNETLPVPGIQQERVETYNQALPANAIAANAIVASMPTLPPPIDPGKDNSRPELYPTNSYHRMAPPPTTHMPSSITTTTHSDLPSKSQQDALPAARNLTQRPVTGDYTQHGYPAVPPLSQPPYPTSSFSTGLQSTAQQSIVTQPQRKPWPQSQPLQQGEEQATEADPVMMPMPPK